MGYIWKFKFLLRFESRVNQFYFCPNKVKNCRLGNITHFMTSISLPFYKSQYIFKNFYHFLYIRRRNSYILTISFLFCIDTILLRCSVNF